MLGELMMCVPDDCGAHGDEEAVLDRARRQSPVRDLEEPLGNAAQLGSVKRMHAAPRLQSASSVDGPRLASACRAASRLRNKSMIDAFASGCARAILSRPSCNAMNPGLETMLSVLLTVIPDSCRSSPVRRPSSRKLSKSRPAIRETPARSPASAQAKNWLKSTERVIPRYSRRPLLSAAAAFASPSTRAGPAISSARRRSLKWFLKWRKAVFRRAELFGQCIEASPSNPKHLDPGSLR